MSKNKPSEVDLRENELRDIILIHKDLSYSIFPKLIEKDLSTWSYKEAQP